MADPYSHLFSSPPFFHQFNPFPSSNPSSHHHHPYALHNFINHPTNSSSAGLFHHQHHLAAASYSSIPSPPSPPLREALPLLSLSPSTRQEQDSHNQDLDVKVDDGRIILHSAKPKEEEEDEEEDDETTVTVALHIGLPSPSAAEMASALSSCNHKEQEEAADGGGGEGGAGDHEDYCSGSGFMLHNKLNKGQYWIPTPSQILIGPTQFSCPVCFKTFNRYNNMQVPSSDLFALSRFPVSSLSLSSSISSLNNNYESSSSLLSSLI